MTPCLCTAPGAAVCSSFAPRWQEVKQSPGCRPQQEHRAGGSRDNAKADGVPGARMLPAAAEAACPALPAASHAAVPARTPGRVSGGVNPCSSAGFSPALGRRSIRPPLKSALCSNASAFPRNALQVLPKRLTPTASARLFAAALLFVPKNQAGLVSFHPQD